MNLDLFDEETVALLGVDRIIDGERYPFSPRIRTLTGIRDKLRAAAGTRAAAPAESLCATASNRCQKAPCRPLVAKGPMPS